MAVTTPAEMTVGVVVPTRNSVRTIEACLDSLRSQTHPCTVVVVDNDSDDATVARARPRADRLEVAGPERSRQRNVGAALLSDRQILGFIDSDMVLASGVVAEVVAQVGQGADAVVVPEVTVGKGFFADVRAFERSLYVGSSQVEAARFFRSDVFNSLGGFDESLTGPEDWDLALRAKQQGANICRTTATIVHDEGTVHYLALCRRKAHYAQGLRAFLAKHGSEGRALLLDRPYLRRPAQLLRHPALGAGLVALKAGESVAVLGALAAHRKAH